jgi:ectoine hydroxylase-related dioxygenase (phytanoyl-CoA dioxygenase family)
MDKKFSKTELEGYDNYGYIIKKGLLGIEEVTKFRDKARADLENQKNDNEIMQKSDKEGNVTLLKMWYTAEDDIYGMLARDERLVNSAAELLNKSVYLYSHKMTMKQPGTGGAWEWHQDYGYWYNNACLAPDMLSIWISLDHSVKANGCLQVLAGSHKIGRIDHVRVDGQTVANKEYVEASRKRFDLKYVEMEPGDALTFHCNLLHRSDANTSDMPRWGYICSYNAVENAPFKRVREYGNYQEMKMVSSGSFMSVE